MIKFIGAVLLYALLLVAVARVSEKYTAVVGVGGLIALLLAASLFA